MPQYIFILGTFPELSLAELTIVIKREVPECTLSNIHPRIVVSSALHIPKNKTLELMNILGGTIKIGEVLIQTPEFDIRKISTILKSYIDSKLPFGITNLSKLFLSQKEVLITIKKLFKIEGQNSRYVNTINQKEVPSVLLKKQRLQEFIFCDSGEELIIAKTIAFQDVDMWSKRDFSRPYADSYSGMLPPKISRIMVNLAVGDKSGALILDPFCGMGTILAESMMMGCDVIGCDYSENVIKKAQANIEWLQKHFIEAKSAKFQLIHCNAVHVSKFITRKVDAIVTEPFLGIPFRHIKEDLYMGSKKASVIEVTNTLKGLEKLYIGALKEWTRLLIDKGKVVIVLPAIHFEGRIYSVKNVVDRCEKLGYTLISGSFIYYRPEAILRRQIIIFQKSRL